VSCDQADNIFTKKDRSLKMASYRIVSSGPQSLVNLTISPDSPRCVFRGLKRVKPFDAGTVKTTEPPKPKKFHAFHDISQPMQMHTALDEADECIRDKKGSEKTDDDNGGTAHMILEEQRALNALIRRLTTDAAEEDRKHLGRDNWGFFVDLDEGFHSPTVVFKINAYERISSRG